MHVAYHATVGQLQRKRTVMKRSRSGQSPKRPWEKRVRSQVDVKEAVDGEKETGSA